VAKGLQNLAHKRPEGRPKGRHGARTCVEDGHGARTCLGHVQVEKSGENNL